MFERFFFNELFLFSGLVGRGHKKFGDRCENTQECGFVGSVCDHMSKKCTCISELPITNHLDKCGKGKDK